MKVERSKLSPQRSKRNRSVVSSRLDRSRVRGQTRSATNLPRVLIVDVSRRGRRLREKLVFLTVGQSLSMNRSPGLKNAFHILLTDRRTHPAAVVELMNSHSDVDTDRLTLLPVESLDAKSIKEAVQRVKRAFASDEASEFILDAYIEGSNLCVRGPRAKLIKIPVSEVRSLSELSDAELRCFEIDPDGAYVHWPQKDIHLGWEQLLAVVDKGLRDRIAKENSDFDRRYGEAIRRCRLRAKVSVDRIKDLSPGELERIEKGIARASSSALKSLAQAHRLGYNQYLALLAKETSKG